MEGRSDDGKHRVLQMQFGKRIRNALFELIMETGNTVADFTIQCETEDVVRYSITGRIWVRCEYSVVRHQPTGYYCAFKKDTINCLPGHDELHESTHYYGISSTPLECHHEISAFMRDCLLGWLGRVKYLVETPDLWESLSNEPNTTINDISQLKDNTPFTTSEKKVVQESLDRIEEWIHEQRLIEEGHYQTLDSKMEYLRESANRMGRKDWLCVVYSNLVSFALSNAMPWAQIQALFAFTVDQLKPIYGHLLRLASGNGD